MRSVNKVILIGNLTRDPEKRVTPDGQTVTTFGVATNREWTTKNGDRKSLADFHNIVAWGRLADLCSEHLRKGKLVYIEGYLKTRVKEREDASKSYYTEIVAYDMIMLDKRREGDDHYIPEAEQEASQYDEAHLDNDDMFQV